MPSMNPQRKPAAQDLANLADTEVTYSRSDAGRAIAAVRDLPIELPAAGKYQVTARGRELHIEETTSGITKFRTSDPSRIGGISYETDLIEIAYKSKSFDKVVLHTAPGAPDPKSITADQEPIVKHLEEYERIKAKTKHTGKDAKRLIELVEIIRDHCARDTCLGGTLPARPDPKPSTARGPQPSGESRGYTSSPESRSASIGRATPAVSGESRAYTPSSESRASYSPPVSGESRGAASSESRGSTPSGESRGGSASESRGTSTSGESRGASAGESRSSGRRSPSSGGSGESRGFGRTAG